MYEDKDYDDEYILAQRIERLSKDPANAHLSYKELKQKAREQERLEESRGGRIRRLAE